MTYLIFLKKNFTIPKEGYLNIDANNVTITSLSSPSSRINLVDGHEGLIRNGGIVETTESTDDQMVQTATVMDFETFQDSTEIENGYLDLTVKNIFIEPHSDTYDIFEKTKYLFRKYSCNSIGSKINNDPENPTQIDKLKSKLDEILINDEHNPFKNLKFKNKKKNSGTLKIYNCRTDCIFQYTSLNAENLVCDIKLCKETKVTFAPPPIGSFCTLNISDFENRGGIFRN